MNPIMHKPGARLSSNPIATHSRPVLQGPSIEEALDKRTIAELSCLQIARMTRAELIRVVQAARMELVHKDVADHIELYDRETLERLVHLARRCCRNQGY